ncbi:MAG: Rrf2 family transcriptional regulator [Chloroflexi bacterium]|nr:Rrf2 family transcriptional regulator [Chloroflexota bacterium]
MFTNARFAVAVHILTYVAMRGPTHQSITSAMIAESVDTNPVVIRRILGVLHQANLVVSRSGTGGGWMLAQPANTITLLQIYRAVKETPLLSVHRHPPNARCPVGQNMVGILSTYFAQVESVVEKQLECVTIDQITSAIQSRAQTMAPPRSMAKRTAAARRAV